MQALVRRARLWNRDGYARTLQEGKDHTLPLTVVFDDQRSILIYRPGEPLQRAQRIFQCLAAARRTRPVLKFDQLFEGARSKIDLHANATWFLIRQPAVAA